MFYEKELIFMKKILEKNNIKLSIINYNNKISNGNGIIFEGLINRIDTSLTFAEYFPDITDRTLYKLSDLLSCKYLFLRLPQTDNKVLIIGPYLTQEVSRNRILEKGEILKLSTSMIKQLEYYYSAVPVFLDDGQLFAIINTFCEQIWGNSDGYTAVDLDKEDHSVLQFIQQDKGILSEAENSWRYEAMEKRYAYESELMHAVSKGQLHKAQQMLLSFSSLSFESRSNDDLRNLKNYSIIMNTLLRKAAQEGGVHPIHLDKVSSDFAKRIEQISSVNFVKEIMEQMLNDYCRLVRIHSIKQYSPLVQRAIIKIDNDLTSDLTLKELSRLNNVSESYFSALFKSETGKTLTDFVNGRRISQAKHLLKTTNFQIQTVAQHCGILDLHYFSKLFKKYTGKTPKQFREINTII